MDPLTIVLAFGIIHLVDRLGDKASKGKVLIDLAENQEKK